MHLRNDPRLCLGCGKNCVRCRDKYELDFSEHIVAHLRLPSKLLKFLDEPEKYLPPRLPKHDILIAINIHEDILLVLPDLVEASGGKAILVPVEDPDWLEPWVKEQMVKGCRSRGLEFSAPKPFCALQTDENSPVISRFIKFFRLGRPKLQLFMEKNKILSAKVLISAPCGNTYFVAQNLLGESLNIELDKTVSKYWHSYPCIASMKMDPELGDTILHKGGYIHLEAVREAIGDASSLRSG
jgi:hypothetical protein